MGGGALMDIGIYPLSFAHHLLGIPQSVIGTTRLGKTGVDEHSAYQLLYPDGALADLWASFQVDGTNEAYIFGERGTLRLSAPFYRGHRLVLQTRAVPEAAGAQNLKPGEALGIGPAPDGEQNFPFDGHGYQFELMEVSRCLREKRTESAIMPLDHTLDVMRTLDAVRAQWGMDFPQD
jgi:predicted dehydrogenase